MGMIMRRSLPLVIFAMILSIIILLIIMIAIIIIIITTSQQLALMKPFLSSPELSEFWKKIAENESPSLSPAPICIYTYILPFSLIFLISGYVGNSSCATGRGDSFLK